MRFICFWTIGERKWIYRMPAFQTRFSGRISVPARNKKGETDESAVVCKVDVTNGALESLPVPAALELTAYQPGKLLVLQRDLEVQEDRLLVIDTDAGNVLEQIYVTPVLGMEGIAYAQDTLCAMVNGELCRWNGSDWTALQAMRRSI